MGIKSEWLFGKGGKRIYPVSHAKSTARGNSTVDKDLSAVEEDVSTLKEKSQNSAGNGIQFENYDINELGSNVLPGLIKTPTTLGDIVSKFSAITSHARFLGRQSVLKDMISNQNINSISHIPSSALLYRIAQEKGNAVLSVNEIFPDANGNVQVNEVPLADNLFSPDNMYRENRFVFNTSGGTEDISNGTAEIVSIRGNTEAIGRVPESITHTQSSGLTVQVDSAVFKEAVDGSGEYTFNYNGSRWNPRLDTYGITVEGIKETEVTASCSNDNLTISVDEAVFVQKMTGIGDTSMNITYDGESWSHNLTEYGISVSGTAASGDTIIVNYQEATASAQIVVTYQEYITGTLRCTKPEMFKSVGLNHFNPDNVLSGYTIDAYGNITAQAGSYVAWIHAKGGLETGYCVYDSLGGIVRLAFSDEVPTTSSLVDTGITQTLDSISSTVMNETDGYIVVATTDVSRLCVHPHWSGYNDNVYEAYEESFVTIPTNDAENNDLPIADYGMPSIGSIADELNFATDTYIKRIGHMPFSEYNLSLIQEMGVSYDYDSNDLFYVLTEEEHYKITEMDAKYNVNDFGTEELLGTDIAADVTILYGANLRDKLRRDVLQISQQTLTAAQKTQVRTNIGVPSIDDFNLLNSDLFDTIPDAHNCFLVYKDITAWYLDGTLWKRIAGTDGFKPFEGIYPGCYFNQGTAVTAPGSDTAGTSWVLILGCNRHWNTYNGMRFNTISVCPLTHFGKAKMNDSNVTTGGYKGSKMNTNIIGGVTSSGNANGTINQQLYNIYGSHLVTITELISNSVNTSAANKLGGASAGASNGWEWVAMQAILMSEVEVFGAAIFSSSGYDTGSAKSQFPAFHFSTKLMIPDGIYYWEKDVASAAGFCRASDNGYAGCNDASNSHFVRPRWNLK